MAGEPLPDRVVRSTDVDRKDVEISWNVGVGEMSSTLSGFRA